MLGLDGKPEKGDFLIKTLEGTMRGNARFEKFQPAGMSL